MAAKRELKGSKTEKNLLAAFAGESQARNRYTYSAEVARKGGIRADRGNIRGDGMERTGARSAGI